MRLTDCFLCSSPPNDCLTLFKLASECVQHLADSHPECLPLLRSHGLVGLERLPRAITLSSPPSIHGDPVWVCDPCRTLFASRAAASAHWTTAHAALAARTNLEQGTTGTASSINNMARSMDLRDHAHRPNDVVINRGPMPLRVITQAPLEPRQMVVLVTATTIDGLLAQLTDAWGERPGMPRWEDLVERGVTVRCQYHDGRAGDLVLEDDRSVGKLRRRMEWGIMRFGGE